MITPTRNRPILPKLDAGDKGFDVPGLVPDVATMIVEMATRDSLHAWGMVSIVCRQWVDCADRILTATPHVKALKATNAVSLKTVPRVIARFTELAQDTDAFYAECRSIAKHVGLPKVQSATTYGEWQKRNFQQGLRTLMFQWTLAPEQRWIRSANESGRCPTVIQIWRSQFLKRWSELPYRWQRTDAAETIFTFEAAVFPWPSDRGLHLDLTPFRTWNDWIHGPDAANWERAGSIAEEVQRWTQKPILIIMGPHDNNALNVHWMFANVDRVSVA